jgi:hypothetical protein
VGVAPEFDVVEVDSESPVDLVDGEEGEEIEEGVLAINRLLIGAFKVVKGLVVSATPPRPKQSPRGR